MSSANREPDPFSSDMDKARRSEPVTGEVKEAQFQCRICGQVFTNQVDLDEHIKSHEKVQKRVQEDTTPAGVG